MTPEEIRLKCLDLAVQTIKNRSVTGPAKTVLAISAEFEQYVLKEEVNQKPVNLNKTSNRRKT